MPFTEELKKLRASTGLSQEKFGERIGKASSTIGQYELGDRQPSLTTLVRISKTFHVSTDHLLGIDKQPGKPYISLEGLSPEQVQALDILVAGLRCQQAFTGER